MTLLASPNRPRGTICHNAACSMRDGVTNVCKLLLSVCSDRQVEGLKVEGQKSGGSR